MSVAAPLTDQHQRTVFDGDLSAPDGVPEAAIDDAVALMRDGRLFRYGEDRNSLPHAALLEEEFAAYIGRKYCVGVNSGGCALFIALKAAGVQAGDKVLANAFTLAPVPGAIAHAGGEPVFVDITRRSVIDLDDLERKANDSGAKYLMLSYMRGHIPDMQALMSLCDKLGITVVEDCAHTMGAGWDGKLTGNFGKVAGFSTQTFKHINSGEGGLLVTDDEDVAAQAILLSGSYMLYRQHRARPDDEVFDRHRFNTPNCSMRMSSLVASLLRPQLRLLDERNQQWRDVYDCLAPKVDEIDNIAVPVRPAAEEFVPSSLQFLVENLSPQQIDAFVSEACRHGVHVKWFGRAEPEGFTSRHWHWQYVEEQANLPMADKVLDRMCDVRLPSGLSEQDCQLIADVLREAMEQITGT